MGQVDGVGRQTCVRGSTMDRQHERGKKAGLIEGR